MSDNVQLIKNEIERLKNHTLNIQKSTNGLITSVGRGRIEAFNDILKFIDSLPEESASEDLEEEMIRWHKEHFGNKRDWEKTSGEYLTRKSQLDIARHFAKWQKQQMMKDVVLETEVLMDCDGDGIETPYKEWLTLEDTEIPCVPDSFKEGDIVKVILVKEDLP